MKNRILEKLMDCPEEYVSGETLSDILGVSRTAIWKYIKEIKAEGYEIDASSKKGYKLIPGKDVLNSFEVGYGFAARLIGKNIIYLREIDSTNTYAKKAAQEGCEDGTVVIADRQTAGKGRMGRTWESAGQKGIWMSVVLRPEIPPEEVQIITLGASVAVVKAIKKATGLPAGIKWPNDIVIEGKKVCGILTEMSCEQDKVNYVIAGIGLNVNHNPEDFPEDLRSRAVSLKAYAEEKGLEIAGILPLGLLKRSDIIKEIAMEFENVYFDINKGNSEWIIEQWREHSHTLGCNVKVDIKGVSYTGTAVDITNEGRLVVNCDDGTVREVMSGEVMVRGILGYV